MGIKLLLLSLLTACVLSCKKDKDNDFATGTVINPGGCYPDAWLIAIDNPDPGIHAFLRPSVISACITCYNCSNAAFIRLPIALAKSGNKIRFTYTRTEASCLSYSEAPNIITVKKCRCYKILLIFRIFGV